MRWIFLKNFSEKLPSPRALFAFVAGTAVALFAFRLYFKTLAPTMLYYDPAGMYDSVMLQVKAYVLGIPNPTGYPTYIMLGHLFTYLPFGDVGWRMNLASAVYAAVCVFVVFLLCRLLTGRVIPSAAAALVFATSATFWSQAIITEVYTLNALFIALDLLVLFLWRRERRDRYLLVFAFLMGLTMTNHMTSGLLLPGALVLILFTDRTKLRDGKLLLKGAGLFLLGLLPYLYLPIRSAMDPPLDEANPANLANFFALVTGSNFESRMFVYGLADASERLSLYVSHLANQFNPLLLLVVIFGALCLAYRREVATLTTLLALYLGWLVYALGYDIRDIYVYFIPTYMISCLFIAVGFATVLDFVVEFASGLDLRRFGRLAAPGMAATCIASVVILAVPMIGMGKTYERVDRSEDMHGRHIMDAVVRGVPENATVMHNGGVMWYMKYVTDHRDDLEIIDPFPSGGWTAESPLWVEKAQNQLEDGRRVFIIFPSDTMDRNEDLFRAAGYELREDESGMYYEVVRRTRTIEEIGTYPKT